MYIGQQSGYVVKASVVITCHRLIGRRCVHCFVNLCSLVVVYNYKPYDISPSWASHGLAIFDSRKIIGFNEDKSITQQLDGGFRLLNIIYNKI